MGVFDKMADLADDAWDRGFEIARGPARGVKAVGDLVADLAQAPFTDDEYGGFLATLYDASVKRLGQAAGGMFGPDTGLGALAGAFPQGVRDVLDEPVEGLIVGAGAGSLAAPGFGTLIGAAGGLLYGASGRSAFEDTETIYREGIGEPLTAGISAFSMGGVGGVFRPKLWRRGYRIAQDRSPGQALALALGAVDITDPEEVEQYAATEAYRIWSGVADAVLRLGVDPTVLGGKASQARRAIYVATNAADGTRTIARTTLRSTRDIDAARNSVRVAKFSEAVDAIKANAASIDEAAGRIRHEQFSDHAHGGLISRVLAEASDTNAAVGALMGRTEDFQKLMQTEPAVTHRIRSLVADASDEARRTSGVLNPNLQMMYAELDVLYPEADRFERLERAYNGAVLGEAPRYSKAGELRGRISISDTYQRDLLTAPLRTVTNMIPGHWLNLNDQADDVKIARMLRDSELTSEEQLAWRGRYMAELTPQGRQRVAVEAEEAAVRDMLAKRGIAGIDVETIIAKSRSYRTSAMGALKKRRYDGAGRGSVLTEDGDGGWTRVHLPLLATQTGDLLPMVDMNQVRHAADQIQGSGLNGHWRAFREAHTSTDLPVDLMEGFYKLWRPATLLRVGWPARVLLDEQLRIVATIGLLTQGRTLLKGVKHNVAGRRRGMVSLRNATPDDLADGNVRAGIGYRDLEVDTPDGPVTIEAPFGTPGDQANVFAQWNSSASTLRELRVGDGQQKVFDDFLEDLRGTGQFTAFTPDSDPEKYRIAWTTAVNKQIRQDPLAREVLQGSGIDDLVDWLSKSDAGRKYARQMGWRAHTYRHHAFDVHEHVLSYVPSAALRQRLLDGEVDWDDLAQLHPDTWPTVHGEDLAQALGQSELAKKTRSIVAKAWRGLGQYPTDVLSRNPFFDAVYTAEVNRLVKLKAEEARRGGGVLDDAVKQDIARAARGKALQESRKLLYDLAEKSEFAQMLRFVSPFYMAWQEVITRWTGIAIDKPAFAARARLIWNSPEKAGFVTDENGYYIDEEGNARDPLTDEVIAKDRVGSERYITLPFPIPGLPTRGGVRFNKKSLNLALTGSPGVGPLVQVPFNEIVKNAPELEDSVKWILPFGTTPETWQLLLPATAKRAFSLAQGDENRMLANQTLRIYFDRMTDFQLGQREEPPTYEEAKDAARDLYKLRTFVSYISPFAPIFDSPYQPYINAYRNAAERLREEEAPFGRRPDGSPVSVDEWFLDTHGEEFFYLSQTLSKSMDGIAPTVEGRNARERFEDLVEKYPDFGGLIVGSDDAGEFSRAVYDSQLSNPVKPGSGTKQREGYTFEEGAKQPEIRLGWIKYGRQMDLIDAARVAAGLPNLQVKGAEQLAALKRAMTAKIAAESPAWAEEFYQQDSRKWQERFAALREIAADERLNVPARQDIAGLRAYLKARDGIVAVLATRRAKSLTAASNQDVALLWESMRAQIVERHVAFAPLFYRYLERDPLEG